MTFFLRLLFYIYTGDNLKVRIFDEEDETDLEEDINEFISDMIDVIDIKYQVSVGVFSEEQIFCFSAMVLYKEKN